MDKARTGFDLENVNHEFIATDDNLCKGKLTFDRSTNHYIVFKCECGDELRWSWIDFIQYYNR